jgi:RNA polymerase sigma factor (TIGR02999 family)
VHGLAVAEGRVRTGKRITFDIIGDVLETGHLALTAGKTGVVYVGGGTPKNFIQQAGVAAYLFQRERPGHSLQATALVNEAYLKLIDVKHVNWQNRAHFLAVSARLMRRILVDHARARGYQKRGGGAAKVSFDEALLVSNEPGPNLIELNDALDALERIDVRKSRVVELRFFGGLSVEESAAVLKVSPDTVMRDWRLAKAWLLRELKK